MIVWRRCKTSAAMQNCAVRCFKGASFPCMLLYSRFMSPMLPLSIHIRFWVVASGERGMPHGLSSS